MPDLFGRRSFLAVVGWQQQCKECYASGCTGLTTGIMLGVMEMALFRWSRCLHSDDDVQKVIGS